MCDVCGGHVGVDARTCMCVSGRHLYMHTFLCLACWCMAFPDAVHVGVCVLCAWLLCTVRAGALCGRRLLFCGWLAV